MSKYRVEYIGDETPGLAGETTSIIGGTACLAIEEEEEQQQLEVDSRNESDEEEKLIFSVEIPHKSARETSLSNGGDRRYLR